LGIALREEISDALALFRSDRLRYLTRFSKTPSFENAVEQSLAAVLRMTLLHYVVAKIALLTPRFFASETNPT
jgi:hypothetical protein